MMTQEGTVLASDSISPTTFNLNELLLSMVQSRACRYRACHIEFTVDLPEDLPDVSVDPDPLEHVLSTLITNAENAIGPDLGRTGQIHVTAAMEGERVHVAVTDNGRGIHWLDMARIFDHQGPNVELSMCVEMMKEHGGDLYAWSSYGKGSTFTLELPAIVEIAQQEIRRPKLSTRPTLEGKRILVVDDEIHVTALIFDVLALEGANIDLANSGMQAIEQIKNKQYDLLICDQRMPDVTGERLYRWVESVAPELRDRILFVTGDVPIDDTKHFLMQTGVRCIRKPFRTAELVDAIEQVLSQSRRLCF
jgi:CheY-like chemotaxis protein